MLRLFEQLNKEAKVILKRVQVSEKRPSPSYSIDLIATSTVGEMPKLKLWRKPEPRDDNQVPSGNKTEVTCSIPGSLKRKLSFERHSESDNSCDRPKKSRTDDDTVVLHSYSRKESKKEKRRSEKIYSDVDGEQVRRIKEKKKSERRLSTEKNRESDKDKGDHVYKKKKDKKRSREQDWPLLERSDVVERPRTINHSEGDKQAPISVKEPSPPILKPVLETRLASPDSRLVETDHISGATTDEDVVGNGCDEIERPDSAMTVALTDLGDVSQISISDAETDELLKSPGEPCISDTNNLSGVELMKMSSEERPSIAKDVCNLLTTEESAASTVEGCETQPSSPVHSSTADPVIDSSAQTPPRLPSSAAEITDSSGHDALTNTEIGVIKTRPCEVIPSPKTVENNLSIKADEEENGTRSQDSPQQETHPAGSAGLSGHERKEYVKGKSIDYFQQMTFENIKQEESRCKQTVAAVKQQLQQIVNDKKRIENESFQLKEEVARLERQKIAKEKEAQNIVSDTSKLLTSVAQLKEERDKLTVAVVDANKSRYETELKLREYQTEVCKEKLKTDWSKNAAEYTTQWAHLKEKEQRICHLSIEVDKMIEAAEKAMKNQSLAEERYVQINNEYLKMKQTLDAMNQDINNVASNISIVKKLCQEKENHLGKLNERRREERLMLLELEQELLNIETAKKMLELERKKEAIDEMDSDDDILEVTTDDNFSDVKIEAAGIAASGEKTPPNRTSLQNAADEYADRDATPPLATVASSGTFVESVPQQQQQIRTSQAPANVAPASTIATAAVAPLVIHSIPSSVSVVQNSASSSSVVHSLSQPPLESVAPRNEVVSAGMSAIRSTSDRGNVSSQSLTPATFAQSPDSISVASIASAIPFFVQFVNPSSVSNILDENDLCRQVIHGCVHFFNVRNKLRNNNDHRVIFDSANLMKDFVIPVHRLASLRDMQLPPLLDWITSKAQESSWYGINAMDASTFCQVFKRCLGCALDIAVRYRDVKFSEIPDQNLTLARGSRMEFIPPTSSSLPTFIIHHSTGSMTPSAQFSPTSETPGGLGKLVNAQNRSQGIPPSAYHETMQRTLSSEGQMQPPGAQRLAPTGWRNERSTGPVVTYPQRIQTASVQPMSVQHHLVSRMPLIPNTAQWPRNQQLHQPSPSAPFNPPNLRPQVGGRQILFAAAHYGHFQQQQTTREQMQPQQQIIHQNREATQVTQTHGQMAAPYQGNAAPATAATSAATATTPAAFTCLKCSKRADQRCGGCSNAYYCSKQCQVDHWDEHVRSCSQR